MVTFSGKDSVKRLRLPKFFAKMAEKRQHNKEGMSTSIHGEFYPKKNGAVSIIVFTTEDNIYSSLLFFNPKDILRLLP